MILESIESVRKNEKQRGYQPPHLSEELILREYSDRLVAKLEEQNIELSQQAEELLMLNKAVESPGEVIFMTDRQGIITYINPESTRLYGYTAEEVLGKVTPGILKGGLLKSEDYEIFLAKDTEQAGCEVANRQQNKRKTIRNGRKFLQPDS